jgi:hypothetical protein
MAKQIKINKVKEPNIDFSLFKQKSEKADILINKVRELLITYDTEPDYIPKNSLECFYLYKNGTDYRLYIYINNEWKYNTLT